MSEQKRLYKSTSDKSLLGVCGGFANYLNLDPVLLRAGYAALTILTGVAPGIIAYFVMAIIMPEEGKGKV